MKKGFGLAAVAVAVMSMMGTAQAVDLVNEDDTSYMALVISGDDEKNVEIQAGETLQGICETCAVQIGEQDQVEAAGDQVVVIKGGVAAIGG
ncbi:MAG: hypothetical protein ACPGO3_12545 [Magnetospiraceae bacterium]